MSKQAAAAEPPVMAHPDAELSSEQVKQLYAKLMTERERVVAGIKRHMAAVLEDRDQLPDELDEAGRYTEQAYLMRVADKEQKLLAEIDHAFTKFQTGEYGVCEGNGEPIGFRRLELRPWTRYSVAFKEELERLK